MNKVASSGNSSAQRVSTDDAQWGYVAAIFSYLLWGIIPLYWKLLTRFEPLELVCHRIVWSFAALTPIVFYLQYAAFRKSQQPLQAVSSGELRPRSSRRALSIGLWATVASLMIGLNWLVFVWCVKTDRVVEGSLGYFMNPLMSVALGVLIFRERIRPIHWLAIAFAASGVIYLTWASGSVPIVALLMGGSFAVYGIVKKKSKLPAIQGLWLETSILFLPAAAWIIYRHISFGLSASTERIAATYRATSQVNEATEILLNTPPALGSQGWLSDALIISTGPVTTIPLLLFAYGARRIPLSHIGLLQYAAPSLQFLVGWYLLHEQVAFQRWIGFGLVWVGLLIFVLTSIRPARPRPANDCELLIE